MFNCTPAPVPRAHTHTFLPYRSSRSNASVRHSMKANERESSVNCVRTPLSLPYRAEPNQYTANICMQPTHKLTQPHPREKKDTKNNSNQRMTNKNCCVFFCVCRADAHFSVSFAVQNKRPRFHAILNVTLKPSLMYRRTASTQQDRHSAKRGNVLANVI